MTAKGKKIAKIVGFSLLGLALVGGGIYLYYRSKGNDEPADENPYVRNTYNTTVSSGATSVNPYAKYNTEEIKKMQTWLYWKGIFKLNKIITDAIGNSGGIDGVVGTGFKTALNEAVKQGYVLSLTDLYNKATA